MKCWCIINLKGICEVHLFRGKSITRQPKEFGPTVFYDHRGDAVLELFRLQTLHPDGEFFLFEAVARVDPSATVPGAWHLERIEGPG